MLDSGGFFVILVDSGGFWGIVWILCGIVGDSGGLWGILWDCGGLWGILVDCDGLWGISKGFLKDSGEFPWISGDLLGLSSDFPRFYGQDALIRTRRDYTDKALFGPDAPRARRVDGIWGRAAVGEWGRAADSVDGFFWIVCGF